jgi:hypothetical protein
MNFDARGHIVPVFKLIFGLKFTSQMCLCKIVGQTELGINSRSGV